MLILAMKKIQRGAAEKQRFNEKNINKVYLVFLSLA
jgi:hypothetical protein